MAIDEQGWLYQASENPVLCDFGTDGQQWEAYVNVMTMRTNRAPHNRSEHDYQNIVVGNGAPGTVFFTSDQGLFIKPDGRNTTLISANGNMSNNIAIGLAVSAGAGAEQYIVITAWDWSPLGSWDSGKSWHTPCSNWGVPSTPDKPRICDRGGVAGVGEGGTVIGMGRSNHVTYFHYHNIYYSSQGGQNTTHVQLPAGAHAHSAAKVYSRMPGSRTEPSGPVYTTMTLPQGHRALLYSLDFGATWNWTDITNETSIGSLAVDPTDGTGKLYSVAPNCFSVSRTQGATWSSCMNASGLEGELSYVAIKDNQTMLMFRSGQSNPGADGIAPLRTQDGGKTWHELESLRGKHGSAVYSWTGDTLVFYGSDTGEIAHGRRASFVWKSKDDGDSWTLETGNIASIAPISGVWYEDDFFLTTSGEGILARRGFEN